MKTPVNPKEELLRRVVPAHPAGVLVVLPGVNSGAYLFDEVMKLWGQTWDVVVLNPPGVGASPLPLPFSAERYARWVLDVLDELGVRQFALLGHSLGSFAAQHVVKMAPTRVTKLVLVSSGVGQPQTAADMGYLVEKVGKSFWQMMEDIDRRPELGLKVLFGSWPVQNPAGYAAFVKERAKWLPGAAVSMVQLTAGGMFSSAGWARGLHVPTLCVHGASDVLVRPENGQRLAESLPQANWLLYHDVGHFPMLEHASFGAHVLSFLGGQASGEMLHPVRCPSMLEKMRRFLFRTG